MKLLESLICLFKLKESRPQLPLRPYNNFAFRGQTYTMPSPDNMLLSNGQELSLDIRTMDCSLHNLSRYNPEKITYDGKTIFPKSAEDMVRDFNPDEIMERHKNPGLGIRRLHKKGFTGKGLSVAIIDQPLSQHQEYMDSLVAYTEYGYENLKCFNGSMHGAAVSSILVGKTCGVAPDTKLYYYAANNLARTSVNYAKALNDILDLNEKLSEAEKIQAVSISWGGMNQCFGADEWNKALLRAKSVGLAVISCNLAMDYGLHFYGLGRKNNANPDEVSSYGCGYFKQSVKHETLGIPMDNRTTACPQSKNGYVHYAHGGWSWAVPFYTGLFLLARQADKNITLEEFHQKALDTGVRRDDLSVVVAQPERLIDALQKERHNKTQSRANANQIRNIKGNSLE